MTILRRSLLVGMALALTNIASAQAGGDLLMPPADGYKAPIPAYHDVPTAPLPRRVYLRADTGYAFHDDPEMVEDQFDDYTAEDWEGAWAFGLGIGRYFTPNIRGDITVDYRNDSGMSATSAFGAPFPGGRQFDVSSLVVLANLYYDFASYHHGGGKDLGLYKTSRFTPYVGVGLGFVKHWSDEGVMTGCCVGTIASGGDTSVAAAFMAGVAMDIRDYWKIDAGYRFLYLGNFETGTAVTNGGGIAGNIRVEDLHAHEFRLGLRYDIR